MSRKNSPGNPPSHRPHRHPEPDDGPPLRRGQLWPRLGDPKPREQIKVANVEIGADTSGTGRSSLFFGKAPLERHAKAGKGLKALNVTVPVDFSTDDVEVLYAFGVTQKGSCCYNREQCIDPSFN